ncbi:MAG: hypothetical protein KAT65_07250, partial [Methanophagales archaeon]|nr:hypothetical protein [Methanophagales archaeon]
MTQGNTNEPENNIVFFIPNSQQLTLSRHLVQEFCYDPLQEFYVMPTQFCFPLRRVVGKTINIVPFFFLHGYALFSQPAHLS